MTYNACLLMGFWEFGRTSLHVSMSYNLCIGAPQGSRIPRPLAQYADRHL